MIPATDLRSAVFASWLIVSVLLMLAVLAPFVLPAETVFGIAPACEARLRGESCVLCGMTTAYVRLAAGDYGGALESNQWSLAVWLASIANFTVAKAYLLIKLLRRQPVGGTI